jgi:hypothetical protein
MIAVRNESMDDLNEIINEKIEILAYYKAERRGLEEQGHEIEDWLQAEEEVLASLREA